jgi:hypothetical protein
MTRKKKTPVHEEGIWGTLEGEVRDCVCFGEGSAGGQETRCLWPRAWPWPVIDAVGDLSTDCSGSRSIALI